MKNLILRVFFLCSFLICTDSFASISNSLGKDDCYLENIDVIKDYVSVAKRCGYSNDQIIEKFLQEIDRSEENSGVLTMSLVCDKKTVYFTVGIICVAGAIFLVGFLYRYLNQKNAEEKQQAKKNELFGQAKDMPFIVNEKSGHIKDIPPVIINVPSEQIDNVSTIINEPLVEIDNIPVVIDFSSEEIENVPTVINVTSEHIEDVSTVINEPLFEIQEPLFFWPKRTIRKPKRLINEC